jgi:hypothetical protein
MPADAAGFIAPHPRRTDHPAAYDRTGRLTATFAYNADRNEIGMAFARIGYRLDDAGRFFYA